MLDPIAAMYREHAPGKRLTSAVVCIWTSTSSGESHRVLPDGCIDILLRRASANEAFRAAIVGTMRTAVVVDDPPGAEYVGVRFRPAEALPFIALPAHEATDREVPLDASWGPVARELEARVSDAKGLAERLSAIERVLERQQQASPPADRRVRALVAAMRSPEPPVPDLELGSRQLRRLFKAHVGLSPKAFERVTRMQRAVSAFNRGAFASWAAVAAECGYFDQSHLVRELKALAGLSPTALAKAPVMTVLYKEATPPSGMRSA